MREVFSFMMQDLKMCLVILFLCLIFTLAACFFDMWTAIEVVRAGKKKPESRPLMKTGTKIMDYYRLIFFVSMVDVLGMVCFPFYRIPYAVVLITLANIFREGLSMYENYKLKKSVAVESVEIASEIVKCMTKEDAERIIKAINERNFTKHGTN